jgi:hypothetical protein
LDKDVSKHWVNTLKAYDKMDEATRNALTPEELKAIRQIVEEVKYDLAIEATRDYFEIEITGPGAGRANPKYIKSVLNKQITKKQQALKDLETQFTEVAQMVAGKYTIAAIVELGKAYENYGNTIKDSYIPSFLDEDQQDLYRMQLEDQAYPYYENATVTYQKALEFAFQFNLYTDASADATRRLGELRPDEYPELTEMLPSAEFLTEKTSTRTYLQTAE